MYNTQLPPYIVLYYTQQHSTCGILYYPTQSPPYIRYYTEQITPIIKLYYPTQPTHMAYSPCNLLYYIATIMHTILPYQHMLPSQQHTIHQQHAAPSATYHPISTYILPYQHHTAQKHCVFPYHPLPPCHHHAPLSASSNITQYCPIYTELTQQH